MRDGPTAPPRPAGCLLHHVRPHRRRPRHRTGTATRRPVRRVRWARGRLPPGYGRPAGSQVRCRDVLPEVPAAAPVRPAHRGADVMAPADPHPAGNKSTDCAGPSRHSARRRASVDSCPPKESLSGAPSFRIGAGARVNEPLQSRVQPQATLTAPPPGLRAGASLPGAFAVPQRPHRSHAPRGIVPNAVAALEVEPVRVRRCARIGRPGHVSRPPRS